MTERLSDSLRDLADTVEPADLYERAVRHSRRIARREAAVGTGAALTAIGLLAGGLWHLPSRDSEQPQYALRSSAAATTGPMPTFAPATPRAPETTGHRPASSRNLIALPPCREGRA